MDNVNLHGELYYKPNPDRTRGGIIITEIVAKKISFKKKGLRFCAVDNHRHKGSITTYDVIYEAKDFDSLNKFMIEKGVWKQGSEQ